MGDILHMYTIAILYMIAINGTIDFGEENVRVTAKDYDTAMSIASNKVADRLSKQGYTNYHIVISKPSSTDDTTGEHC